MLQEYQKILTPADTGRNLSVFDQPEDRGIFADMKVKIRTLEKCPICGRTFKLTGRGLVCTGGNHQKTTPNTYFLDWFYRGERFKLYGYDNFREAVTKAGSIEQEIAEGKFKPGLYRGSGARTKNKYAFSVRYEKWVSFKEKTRKPGYIRKLRQYQEEFNKIFGNEDVRTIGTDRVMDYYEMLVGAVTEKTQYNKLGVLHSFLQDLLDRDVIHSMPKFPKIHYQKKEPRWIDTIMQSELLQEIPEEHRPIFRFLFMTGARPSEARALHWTDVDFKNREITIRHNFSDGVLTATKTGEERKIPLTTALAELFGGLPRLLHVPFVFTYKEKPYYESKLGKLWRKSCKEKNLEGVRLYDGCRHSFASQLVNQNHSLEIIGEILGHSDTRTTRKYAHVSMDAMRAVMEGMK